LTGISLRIAHTAGWLLLALWLAGSAARATTLVALSLEQLVQASSVIVRARVVSRESRWTDDRRGIVTLTTLQVESAEKGTPTYKLVLEQPGGQAGNVRLRVSGTALLEPGTSYFLFLEPAADPSRLQPVGLMQGVYPVVRDAHTGEERVPLPFGRRFREGGKAQHTSQTSPPSIPAREFRRAIAVAAAKPLTVPAGVRIPAVVTSAVPLQGRRVRLAAVTTADVFPHRRAVIPRGSRLAGWAVRRGEHWEVDWDSVTVRGSRSALAARSRVPEKSDWNNVRIVAEVNSERR
jgi:hypothetical protein